MLNQMKLVSVLLTLVPQILQIVKAIETPGNGIEKAATVTELTLAAFEIVPDDLKKQIGLDKVQAFVSKVIEIAVNFLNKIGAFGAAK